jgi:hypothetical protein
MNNPVEAFWRVSRERSELFIGLFTWEIKLELRHRQVYLAFRSRFVSCRVRFALRT